MSETTGRDATIFALASGAGQAGVAVLRVSGPRAFEAGQRLTGRSSFRPRHAHLCTLRDPVTSEVLDEAVVIAFPAPASFTGEDVLEIQGHGGAAVVAAVMNALGALAGLRLADPGEFSRRAVLNGKMDLTQAEGLVDLIEARTQGQRRQAQRQREGALGRLYDRWREQLVRALAYAEAEIDFPDEGDIPEGLSERVSGYVRPVLREIETHLQDGARGERLRDGVRVVLFGAPNAGKSTLLNALAGRDAAIVSETAGTTRDVIEVPMDLGGVPVIIADTAGLRGASEAIEAEGVRRARARADAADLRILVSDAQDAGQGPDRVGTAEVLRPGDLVFVNKADLATATSLETVRSAWSGAGYEVIAGTARDGADLHGFMTRLRAVVTERFGVSEAPALTRQRHRDAVEQCRAALGQALAAGDNTDLVAEDLRLAVRALGRITGAVDVEDLLDVIFRDFCIGK